MGEKLLPVHLFLYNRFIAGMVLSAATIQYGSASGYGNYSGEKFLFK